MDLNKANELCKEAIALWGQDEQKKMWHEEVGELMQAINKHHRKPNDENLDHLCEEVVDVKILTMQLELMVPQDRINYWFNFKMNRLEFRINAEKERRAQYAEDLKNNNPRYFEIFKLIHDMNKLPLDGEIQELIRVVLETEKA